MAAVQLLSFQFVAQNQKTKGFHYFLPTALSVPNAILHGQAVAAMLDAISGMTIPKARMVVDIPLVGLKTEEIAGTFADRGVLMGFDVENSNYGWSGWIPGISPANITAGQISGTTVTTLMDYLIADAVGAGNGHATDDDGGELIAKVSQVLTTRRK